MRAVICSILGHPWEAVISRLPAGGGRPRALWRCGRCGQTAEVRATALDPDADRLPPGARPDPGLAALLAAGALMVAAIVATYLGGLR